MASNKVSGRAVIDLVESGGGMWKISSLPAIEYCLSSGAQLRRLAGVSGGGLLVGLMAAGATLAELQSALPQIHDVGFMDAFQIPARLREVFPRRVLVENTAGRLPKRREIRLGELPIELSINCARLNISGSIGDVLQRVSDSFRGTTFKKIILAAAEVTSFLRGLHLQEVMQRAVEGAEQVTLSSRATPDVSVVDAMTASCAFFLSYKVEREEFYDGFYFSNLPTRAIVKNGRKRTAVLAHQTDPFMGNTWTSWFLRRLFNKETIAMLHERCAEDERLADKHGVLLSPRVQEIGSPFSGAVSSDLIDAGRKALEERREDIDRKLLNRASITL